MRKIDEIIVHCTATPRGRDVKAIDVDRWHRERGFDCIGYHYLVGIDGSIEAGRDETRPGAHCRGHNLRSIGVCYVGGCEEDMTPADTRTPAQRLALIRLLVELKKRYPNVVIRSHRDFAPKSCPSFDATKEYSGL